MSLYFNDYSLFMKVKKKIIARVERVYTSGKNHISKILASLSLQNSIIYQYNEAQCDGLFNLEILWVKVKLYMLLFI